MRKLRFTLSILGLALAAIPASANSTYSSCTSGCGTASGTYSTWQTAGSGLNFTSLITFVSVGVNGGIYTDNTTGTVFTNYSSGGNVDTGAEIVSSSFLQWYYTGTGSGIEIDLPANTYAFAMSVSDCNGGNCSTIQFNNATVGLGTQSSHGTNYSLTIPSGGPSQFFGIVSDTPITSIFLASGTIGNNNLAINSFELGQEAPTPEASTFFTMGGGLVGLYFCRRPRRSKTSLG